MQILQFSSSSPYFSILTPGTSLIKLGRYTVNDILDVYFYYDEARTARFLLPNGKEKVVQLFPDYPLPLHAEFEKMSTRRCINNCRYCFVDQMPPGMRPTLYIKDDDYRHSFLYGTFITLSNLTSYDLKRIQRLYLSPLYVTLNSLDPKVRYKLMGENANRRNIKRILAYFRRYGIQLHLQFVICPGYNDFPDLFFSLKALQEYQSIIRSVALVPVGVTRYRRDLSYPVIDMPYARDFIAEVGGLRDQLQYGNRLQLADEWFVRAKKPFPPVSCYKTSFKEEFPQWENGVGMCRWFIRKVKRELKNPLLSEEVLPGQKKLLTSMSALAMWKELKPFLEKQYPVSLHLIPVINNFFGPSVTVNGLLSGKDVLRCLQKTPGTHFALWGDCLQEDGKFLDDMSVKDLVEEANVSLKILRSPEEFAEYILYDRGGST